MDMTGTQRIEASPAAVWRGLNDVAILQQCIPGCESIEKISDTIMNAKVTLRVGPVKASFMGKVTLSDLDPPHGYTITGEGSGGAAGFAKGAAKVRLAADGPATVLTYEVKVDIGGKLAQLGGRLIDGTAKKLAAEFFENFSQAVAPAAVQPIPPDALDAGSVGQPTKPGWFRSWMAKVAG
jgi:carbon monoxide dehydrogenase subunit G